MGNDNGILDIETINNELMEQRNINTKPESNEALNTKNITNSGNMNPLVSAPATMEAVNPATPAMPAAAVMEAVNPAMPAPATMGAVNPATPAMPAAAAMEAVNPATPAMPAAAVMEAVNPATPAPVTMEAVNPATSAMPAAAAMEAVNPATPNFSDLEIQDNSQNFNQTTTPETMDSRSFTNTETDWKRVPEGTNNYVDFADSRDDYSEREPLNFFQGLLAFLVSFILAGVFVFIIVKFYNIKYISKLQCLASMLPAMGLFYGFYYMTGKRKMSVPVAILFIVLNVFISYFMFHAVMAHGVRGLYAELSTKEAWQFVDIMKKISGTKRLYYTQFASIFGVGSLSGIIFGYCGIKGIMTKDSILDKAGRGGRRY